MGKQRIGSYELDIASSHDIEKLTGRIESALRVMYAGEDYLTFTAAGNPANTVTLNGPPSGYAWALMSVSAQLSGAGTLSVYLASTNTAPPVGVAQSVANGANNEVVINFSRQQVIIRNNPVTLYCQAASINAYRVAVKSVPAEMIGKL